MTQVLPGDGGQELTLRELCVTSRFNYSVQRPGCSWGQDKGDATFLRASVPSQLLLP